MRHGSTFMKLGVGAAVATCLFAGTANAQSLVKGTFTLPHDVRWGRTLLPAGHYSIQIDSVNVPARVTTPTGAGRALVLARSFDSAMAEHPTALLITRSEGEWVVRAFNWREGNESFVYSAFSRAERKALAQANDTEDVPVVMAKNQAPPLDVSRYADPETLIVSGPVAGPGTLLRP